MQHGETCHSIPPPSTLYNSSSVMSLHLCLTTQYNRLLKTCSEIIQSASMFSVALTGPLCNDSLTIFTLNSYTTYYFWMWNVLPWTLYWNVFTLWQPGQLKLFLTHRVPFLLLDARVKLSVSFSQIEVMSPWPCHWVCLGLLCQSWHKPSDYFSFTPQTAINGQVKLKSDSSGMFSCQT